VGEACRESFFVSYRGDDDRNGAARIRDVLTAKFGLTLMLTPGIARLNVMPMAIGSDCYDRASRSGILSAEPAGQDPDHKRGENREK
jgi:hypothetical protein